METPGTVSRGLWVCLLAPLLFSSCAVATGQNIKVTQLPETLSVKAGENITLQCTLTGGNVPGGVRWYKGPDRSQTPIYSDKQGASNRGLRVVAESNADFSINIQNVQPEDAGTYYCVKFRAAIPERELTSGKGTVVSVIATPSQPVVLGPTRRITVGSRASFNCSTGGFSPREITVSWLKDGKKIPTRPANILNSDEKQSITYRAESTVEILLGQGDVKSHLICQIQHASLDHGPLEQSFPLGDVLRVPPKVHLQTNLSSPIQLNASVMVTCNAESFYPGDAKVELFAKDAQTQKGKVGAKTSNPDGTFSLKSNLEMTASEDRNLSVFFCQVQHDSQPPVNVTTTLLIGMQPDEDKILGDDPRNSNLTMIIIAVVVCVLLVVLVIAVIYLIQARHSKGKDSTSVRLHEAEKSPPLTNQDTDPNNVAYADLNFDKEAQKRPHPAVENPVQSEYATLQAVQPLPNDDNVTYADLDMVQLNKAPKRPAPKAEEASSEYASVQVQNK